MIWQLLVNGLFAASPLVLMALGLSLLYRVSGFFHFAHGALLTLSAYTSYFLHFTLGIDAILALTLSFSINAVFAVSLKMLIYERIRKHSSSSLLPLLSSLGVYTIIINLIALLFGNDVKLFRLFSDVKYYNFLGANFTSLQIISLLTAIIVSFIFILFMRHSRFGKLIDAVSINRELAKASGISVKRVVSYSYLVSSLLASFAGFVISIDVDIFPMMGMQPMLIGIICVIVATKYWKIGVVISSIVVALLQSLFIWIFNTHWQEALVFIVLMVYLMIIPRDSLLSGNRKV